MSLPFISYIFAGQGERLAGARQLKRLRRKIFKVLN
jgi:hypothetical protein